MEGIYSGALALLVTERCTVTESERKRKRKQRRNENGNENRNKDEAGTETETETEWPTHLGEEVGHELIVRAQGFPFHVQRMLGLDKTHEFSRADLKRQQRSTYDHAQQQGRVDFKSRISTSRTLDTQVFD